MDECPSPDCKIGIIKELNKKVSKNYLGISLSILVAAASTIAFLAYNAYDNARDVLAAETVKAKALAEVNREGISDSRTNIELIKQSLETINERLKDLKNDQKEVNTKILKNLEEIKDGR